MFGSFDDHIFDRKFGQLSGGERRRVGLAKLLINELDLILLDEPTNHLDVEGVAWLATYLNNRRGLAVVVVTHDQNLSVHIAEKLKVRGLRRSQLD